MIDLQIRAFIPVSRLAEFGLTGVILAFAVFFIYLAMKREQKQIDKRKAGAISEVIEQASRQIEEEGGTIRHIAREVSLWRKPQNAPPFNLVSRFDVEYGHRSGTWIVLSNVNRIVKWVWRDVRGDATLPVDRSDAIVDNRLATASGTTTVVVFWERLYSWASLCLD